MARSSEGRDIGRFAAALSTARGVAIHVDLRPWRRVLERLAGEDVASLPSLAEAFHASTAPDATGGGDKIETEDYPVRGLALAAEAARRSLGLEPFEGQLIAALALRRGMMIQMQTGEGKTLAVAMAAALGARDGTGVHVLTANDYLARRDAEWMGPLYRALGLRAASVVSKDGEAARREAYAADVTYLTARESGFDYLRDQLRRRAEDFVQRPFSEAIVDEADFILVDEARIPLVIAGAGPGDPGEAEAAARIASKLVLGTDYSIDREGRRAPLNAAGWERAEALLAAEGLAPPRPEGGGEEIADPGEEARDRGMARVHAALIARHLLKRDVDYLLREGAVEPIDGFTGRRAERRRWPWGVQAALEVKEGLKPKPEGRIYATLTIQNLASLYPRLSGMTATAVAAAPEISDTYGLGTLVIPPGRPSRRVDLPDLLFESMEEKRDALVAEIEGAHREGRPVLVGTASVQESRELAEELGRRGLPCRVLNAANDSEEAAIVAEAGRLGALTISTNMAGRGTDIRLGGPAGGENGDREERRKLEELGGLLVLGTNRHESRRVDDQLRGRSGRQGEPGSSRFFLSLEDPVFLRFGVAEFLPKRMRRGGAIEEKGAHREIERAQLIIEAQHHRERGRLARRSRVVEYERRHVRAMRDEALRDGDAPPWLKAALPQELSAELALAAFLLSIDDFWARHLETVEEIAEGINLSALGGRDPETEFLRRVAEAYEKGLDGLGERTAALVERAKRAAGDELSPRDLERGGVDFPSSTWTYQIEEAALPGFSLAGLAAGNPALAMAAPLMMLLALASRLFPGPAKGSRRATREASPNGNPRPQRGDRGSRSRPNSSSPRD